MIILGDPMALFTILVVALVVGVTWWDWRSLERASRLPQWIGGLALGGIVAASLTGFTSMGSILYAHTVSELQAGFGTPAFWPECAFLLSGLGVIIAAARKRSAGTLVLLAAVLAFGLFLGLVAYV